MRSLIPNINLPDVDAQALLAEVKRNNLLTELREALDARPQAQTEHSPRRRDVPREVWARKLNDLALHLEAANLASPKPKNRRQAMIQGCKHYELPNGKTPKWRTLYEYLYQRDCAK